MNTEKRLKLFHRDMFRVKKSCLSLSDIVPRTRKNTITKQRIPPQSQGQGKKVKEFAISIVNMKYEISFEI